MSLRLALVRNFGRRDALQPCATLTAKHGERFQNRKEKLSALSARFRLHCSVLLASMWKTAAGTRAFISALEIGGPTQVHRFGHVVVPINALASR
jgi:hypothetical protein